MDQPMGLVKLLRLIRRSTRLSIILFSGHTYDRILETPFADDIMKNIDVLVSGPYAHKVRASEGLRGSANQMVHLLTHRHTLQELRQTPCGEIRIDERGDIRVSGIDPPELNSL